MGKEQDLLVAVKSGDLLAAHRLLSKVKCNKTSECGAVTSDLLGGSELQQSKNKIWVFFNFTYRYMFYWCTK